MVERRYALIGVEGNHDQAFIAKILKKIFGLQKFGGDKSKLEKFWEKFIPVYPKSGDLYKRLDMPTILHNDDISVAIYAGEGESLADNLVVRLSDINISKLVAFAIVADADKEEPMQVTKRYQESFKEIFPAFPSEPGTIAMDSIRLGIYILPDNGNPGVLDTVLCQCGENIYPDLMEKATEYLNYFSDEKLREMGIKWKPFDYQKAKIATVASVLKPGKTNTASISDNKWVCENTLEEVPALKQLVDFLRELLF
ncbi:MAG: DUF3226 domain-containing protein [Cyanothece sp. SIO2G6]|nr:DUF3226 domain-containing protein [Cyanothece sp. SIO2G6]